MQLLFIICHTRNGAASVHHLPHLQWCSFSCSSSATPAMVAASLHYLPHLQWCSFCSSSATPQWCSFCSSSATPAMVQLLFIICHTCNGAASVHHLPHLQWCSFCSSSATPAMNVHAQARPTMPLHSFRTELTKPGLEADTSLYYTYDLFHTGLLQINLFPKLSTCLANPRINLCPT